MTATTDAPTALEQIILHGPPGGDTGTPGDTLPRGPSTGGGDHGAGGTVDNDTGGDDHGDGGTTDNTTAGTEEDEEVDGAGAPSEDENQGPPAAVHSSTTTVDWQCTEHGRLWSDPLRWTPDVLLHRVVDTDGGQRCHLFGQTYRGAVRLSLRRSSMLPPMGGGDGGVHTYRTGSRHSHGSRHP